jgi:hypothetical protein
MADDKEFFDQLYQMWSKTTWADRSIWESGYDDEWGFYRIDAVIDSEGSVHPVASFVPEADAQFIVAMHGLLPEIIRRFLEAADTAEKWEERYDEAANELWARELEVMGLEARIDGLEESLYATPKDDAW